MHRTTLIHVAALALLGASCATTSSTQGHYTFAFAEEGQCPLLRGTPTSSDKEVMSITNTRLPDSNEHSPAVIDDHTVAFVTDSSGQLDLAYIDYTKPTVSVVGGLAATSDDEKAPFVVGSGASAKCFFATNADGRFQVMSGALPKVRAQLVEAQSAGHANWPHVSGDGKRMLYSVVNARGVYEIWMRDFQSGAEFRLLEGQRARWNPANPEEFVFTRFDAGTWTICKYSLNGSQELLNRNGADNFDPEFSPDGRHIAYTSNKNGSSDIWVMRADGSDASVVVDHGAIDCQPVWTPDGESLIFTSDRLGGFDLWMVSNLEFLRAPGTSESPSSAKGQ